MTLSRQIVVPGLLAEYRGFAELLRDCSADDWATPSRCEGWSVGDVAGHVVGQLTDVVNLRLDGLGSPEATARQVDERRGRDVGALVEELESGTAMAESIAESFDDAAWDAPGPQGTSTLGFGLEALWFDTYLHAEDIRDALGLPSVAGEALEPSLSHIAQVLTDQGWSPASLEFDGYGPFPVSGGGDRKIVGDAYTFVLASTGRADPAVFELDETVNIYR